MRRRFAVQRCARPRCALFEVNATKKVWMRVNATKMRCSRWMRQSCAVEGGCNQDALFEVNATKMLCSVNATKMCCSVNATKMRCEVNATKMRSSRWMRPRCAVQGAAQSARAINAPFKLLHSAAQSVRAITMMHALLKDLIHNAMGYRVTALRWPT